MVIRTGHSRCPWMRHSARGAHFGFQARLWFQSRFRFPIRIGIQLAPMPCLHVTCTIHPPIPSSAGWGPTGTIQVDMPVRAAVIPWTYPVAMRWFRSDLEPEAQGTTPVSGDYLHRGTHAYARILALPVILPCGHLTGLVIAGFLFPSTKWTRPVPTWERWFSGHLVSG